MDINKLPKWAQEKIRDLERERDAAVVALNEFQDKQTPSRIWTEDIVCTGEESGPTAKRNYFQTRSLEIQVGDHKRSTIHLLLRPDEKCLDISSGWCTLHFKPVAGNVIRIEEPKP